MTNSYYKEMIRLADSIADKAHEGQTDRNGWPYISHPRRVALGARKLVSEMASSTSPDTSLEELKAEVQIVALLHDTVEDTGVSLPYLARYFSPQIVAAVEALTRRPGESRVSYLGRVRANDLARLVKRADIMDNLDPHRLAKLAEPTRSCLHIKYEHSLELLGLNE
ncbi:HD domain-containing protein [uncultured Rothia sp.]|uniref:HD domain-containing protein n=1 Tax=uncultured Rothia sp. TaxID=316088 RepID=UPI00263354B1|nr:HD domain-containing protein [uncultured Rothia sp.]